MLPQGYLVLPCLFFSIGCLPKLRLIVKTPTGQVNRCVKMFKPMWLLWYREKHREVVESRKQKCAEGGANYDFVVVKVQLSPFISCSTCLASFEIRNLVLFCILALVSRPSANLIGRFVLPTRVINSPSLPPRNSPVDSSLP